MWQTTGHTVMLRVPGVKVSAVELLIVKTEEETGITSQADACSSCHYVLKVSPYFLCICNLKLGQTEELQQALDQCEILANSTHHSVIGLCKDRAGAIQHTPSLHHKLRTTMIEKPTPAHWVNLVKNLNTKGIPPTLRNHALQIATGMKPPNNRMSHVLHIASTCPARLQFPGIGQAHPQHMPPQFRNPQGTPVKLPEDSECHS
ncbi:hypothetical protein Pelo_15147 [Pelomyxa schiedti]|nr:hypothetical protein Pelo_15147 [Pelomyxa schiedti]